MLAQCPAGCPESWRRVPELRGAIRVGWPSRAMTSSRVMPGFTELTAPPDSVTAPTNSQVRRVSRFKLVCISRPILKPDPSTVQCQLLRHAVGSDHQFHLSLIHISEPTRRTPISYAVFCLKKKK